MNVLKKMAITNLCEISVAKITRDDAMEMLQRNAKNRPITKSNVDLLRRTMDDGRWMFNGDTIVLDRDQNLKSGQHRLSAFASSTVEELTIILVRLFADDDVLVSLNRGKAMCASQYLRIKGMKNTTALASTARIFLIIDKCVKEGLSIRKELMPRQLDYIIEDAIAQHPEIDMFCNKTHNIRMPGAVCGTLAFSAIFQPVLKDRLKGAFDNALAMSLQEGSLAQSLFRIGMNSVSNIEGQFDTIRKTMCAIRNHVAGNPTAKNFGMDIGDYVAFLKRQGANQ